jgi:hypothetical protein
MRGPLGSTAYPFAPIQPRNNAWLVTTVLSDEPSYVFKAPHDREALFFIIGFVTVVSSPVHPPWLRGKVVRGIWIIRVQAPHDLEPCCPILLRFPLRKIAQPMAAPACNPPSPVQDTAVIDSVL